MRYTVIGIICLVAGAWGPAEAQTTPSPVPPGHRADAVPKDGVIHPNPDATADQTVRPPNVDPSITIPPPGTPGGDPKVVPK
jgi:hypothetical protein